MYTLVSGSSYCENEASAQKESLPKGPFLVGM